MKGTVLVIGWGSAGQRHQRNLDELGYPVWSYDPYNAEATFYEWQGVVHNYRAGEFAAVVIATPPDLHLEMIGRVAHWGLPIFCEKPLCDFGQIAEAKTFLGVPRLYFTWNYRWHPSLLNPNAVHADHHDWWIRSRQSRERWPSWGFILDHLSHSFDILYWKSGYQPHVEQATQRGDQMRESWWVVGGTLGEQRFILHDFVNHRGVHRRVDFHAPHWCTQIKRTPQMFADMWRAFDSVIQGSADPPLPGLGDALVVQECLEQCYQLAGTR